MRGRPDVDVKLPTVVHPGDEAKIVVTLESHSETPIDFVDVQLWGEEALPLVDDGHEPVRSRPILDKTVRLREKGTLEEGKHRFETTVKIPADAPGSYLGNRVHVRYEARIHVSIPWWPDLRESFEIFVEPRPSARPKPAPATRSSDTKADTVIELSLADTAFAAGDEVTGAFAIGNAPSRDSLGVEISLLAIETTRVAGHTRRTEQYRYMVPSVFRAPRTGVEVPFRFRVPKDVHPSFKSPWCDLQWTVQAVLRTTWSSGVAASIPVTVDRYATVHDPAVERPRIGAEKWRRLWSEAGAKHGFTLAKDRLALEGARVAPPDSPSPWSSPAEIQIEITRDEGEDEPTLVATMRYPSLGIRLRATKQLLLFLPTDLDNRLPGHKVECRDREQGEAFLTPRLCEALGHFHEFRIDDGHAIVSTPGGGLDAASLDDFLSRAAGLADALSAATAAIPPPASMKPHLAAWREFAVSTGAHLCPGGMSLTSANVDGAVFDITSLFSDAGEINAARLSLELDPPLPFKLSLTELDTFSAAPPGSREQALALKGSVQSLVLTSYSIHATLAGPTENPADLRPKLSEIQALARRLRGERSLGPYR